MKYWSLESTIESGSYMCVLKGPNVQYIYTSPFNLLIHLRGLGMGESRGRGIFMWLTV